MPLAYEEWVSRYLDDLYAAAACWVGDEARAADLVVEAVRSGFRAFRAFRRGEGREGDVRLWLLGRLARVYLARAGLPPDAVWADAEIRPRPTRPGATPPPASPDGGEAARAVAAAWVRLDAGGRIVLGLVNVLGLRYAQAAACLGLPPERVRRIAAAARERLAASAWAEMRRTTGNGRGTSGAVR